MTDVPEGFIQIPSGDFVTIAPLTFSRARICVGPDTDFVRDGY